jgi:hypothetical protein
MQGTESGCHAFDRDALGIDQQRLGFAQRQRLRAFLTDSAQYLGLTLAGSGRQQQEFRAGVALALEQAQLTVGVRGC